MSCVRIYLTLVLEIEEEMLGIVVIIFIAITTCFSPIGHAQKTSGQTKARREKFERKGVKAIKTRITFGQDGEITAEIITKGREMRLYDQGGHVDCRQWSPTALKDQKNGQRIESALETARNFIWEHWQNRKRGYIRLTFNSVDAVSTSHIFIEPDANGELQIVWRIARWHAMTPSGIDDLPIIRQVERKIDDKSVASLIFKDAGGEKWQTL